MTVVQGKIKNDGSGGCGAACLPACQPGVEIQRTTPHRTAPEPGGNRGARCKRSGPGFFFPPQKKYKN